MRVVIAPDSFKGTIGATAAAAALANGWHDSRPGDHVTCIPLADGGEGTLEVLAAGSPGARWHPARVRGPVTGFTDTCWLELPGRTGVVELAGASGLPLLATPDPLRAHSAGVGDLVGRALDAGVTAIMRLPRSSISSKGITPGATELTVMSGARALASARVSMITPALDAQ